MTDQSRNDFEGYAALEGLSCKIDEFGDYIEWEARLAYSAWKAARAIPVKLPAIDPNGSGHGDGRPSFEQYCAAQCNSVIEQCRAAVEAAGYEVE